MTSACCTSSGKTWSICQCAHSIKRRGVWEPAWGAGERNASTRDTMQAQQRSARMWPVESNVQQRARRACARCKRVCIARCLYLATLSLQKNSSLDYGDGRGLFFSQNAGVQNWMHRCGGGIIYFTHRFEIFLPGKRIFRGSKYSMTVHMNEAPAADVMEVLIRLDCCHFARLGFLRSVSDGVFSYSPLL